jgi:hypothetical protein
LITKKPQAEIMIKMRETYKPKNGVIRGVQGIAVLDKELLDLRQSYFDQIRALHCRNYNNPKT